MFTVCPKCTLTLAVTAADLRAGQGYVRCGRCLNVFNALLALSEEPADQGHRRRRIHKPIRHPPRRSPPRSRPPPTIPKISRMRPRLAFTWPATPRHEPI